MWLGSASHRAWRNPGSLLRPPETDDHQGEQPLFNLTSIFRGQGMIDVVDKSGQNQAAFANLVKFERRWSSPVKAPTMGDIKRREYTR